MLSKTSWKCSEHLNPFDSGDSYQVGYVGLAAQIITQVVQDGGIEVMASVGDTYYFGTGHDGWLVCDEIFIGYYF